MGFSLSEWHKKIKLKLKSENSFFRKARRNFGLANQICYVLLSISKAHGESKQNEIWPIH